LYKFGSVITLEIVETIKKSNYKFGHT